MKFVDDQVNMETVNMRKAKLLVEEGAFFKDVVPVGTERLLDHITTNAEGKGMRSRYPDILQGSSCSLIPLQSHLVVLSSPLESKLVAADTSIKLVFFSLIFIPFPSAFVVI